MPSSKCDSSKSKPSDLKEFSCKQSKHAHTPKVPLCTILVAPGGYCKTVLLSSLILNIDGGCFERIFISSPSVDIDETWEPVEKHQSDDMNAIEKDNEELQFHHYGPADLEHIIGTQHKIIKLMKAHNRKHLC